MTIRFLAVAACAVVLSACGHPADVASKLTVQLVSTGWRGAGTGSRSKVVPSAAVRVTNVSNGTLPSVQLNAVFHRVGDAAAWGSAFVTAAGSAGLSPGSAATVTLNSELGYTGEDPQDALLTNSHFVDATVDVFARYGSAQWTRVGAFAIDRQVLRP